MIGTQIGPYRVLERLGAGGMGEVFLAEDTRLRRQVALKRVTANALHGTEGRARVMREARAVARLHHPGIATIFDVVEVPQDDTVLIVMEYVRGETLAARLKRGPLSVDEAVDIAGQIADALADAHAHGVLHCDLKPSNVHITPEGRAKILDFGLAQLTAAAIASEDTRLASSDRLESDVSGSPGYMAPERLSGTIPDERGDVYALGVVTFEMLIGRRPFSGGSLMAIAVAALTTPAPSPTSIDPRIPESVSAVVLRALSSQAANRFPSAVEFAKALRGHHSLIAGGAPASAEAPARLAEAPPARRRPPPLIAAGVLALAGLAVVLFVWRPWQSDAPSGGTAPAVVVKPFENVNRDAANDAIGVGITDDLTAKLAALPNVAVVSRDTTAAYLVKNPNSPTLVRDLGASFVVEGGFERKGDRLDVTVTLRDNAGGVTWTQHFARPLPELFTLQREIAEGLAGALKLSLTTQDRTRLQTDAARNVEAFADYSQGRQFLDRIDVRGSIDHAIEAFNRAIAKDPSFALAHAGLGSAYWQKYVETKDAAWTAQAIAESLQAAKLDERLAEVHVALGTIYAGLGKTQEAVDELREALKQQPNNDDAHRILGDIFAKAGRTEDAVAEFRSAIAIRPNYWQNHNRLGVTLMRVGRYADAEASLRRVTELQPDSVSGFNNLGVVAMMQDNPSLALQSFTRGAEITPRASTYSNLGTVHFWNGRFDEARKAYEQAIALSPADASLHRNLGDAFTGLNDAGRARAAYDKALSLAESQRKVNPRDASILSMVAVLEAKQGNKAPARIHADEALALAPKDAEVYYRSAVVAALSGDAARALTDFTAAANAGYSMVLARHDPDLKVLHDRREYAALIDHRAP